MVTLSTNARHTLANEVTPIGRRLFQLARVRSGQRSYQLTDEFFALVGSGRALIDGALLERGLVREIKHRDCTRSYALTKKGWLVAAHIANHIGS